ncbi:MAG: hypothetical protein JST59_18100 [Actinobacteria bacterium]|nr:hypothetical protein [Actinomycetota bacterium]
MRLLGDRHSTPRLKPGITYTRLVIFLVVVAVLAVVTHHFVEGSYPPIGDCGTKEIDTGRHKEGTCTEEGTTIVVVNKGGALKLASLEARPRPSKLRRTTNHTPSWPAVEPSRRMAPRPGP